MMENEPPVHTRLRSLVAKAFARGHVERLRPRVQQLADELLDRGRLRSGFDLIADYAEPLPVAVIAELLGVPEADRHLLRPWSQAIVRMYEYGRTPDRRGRAPIAAAEEFADYMRDLADGAGAQPGDDLVSHLVPPRRTRAAADRRRAGRLGDPAAQRRARGVGQRLRQRRRGAAGPPRPARPAARRPEPGRAGGRGDDPLRRAAAALRAHGARGRARSATSTVPAGARVAALLGSANRDPAAFDDAGCVRRRPPAQPPHRLRRRTAPLPRRTAGPDGAADLAADAARPVPDRWSWPASRCAGRPSCCAATSRCPSAADASAMCALPSRPRIASQASRTSAPRSGMASFIPPAARSAVSALLAARRCRCPRLGPKAGAASQHAPRDSRRTPAASLAAGVRGPQALRQRSARTACTSQPKPPSPPGSVSSADLARPGTAPRR